jgi:hypothetical protein
MRRQSRGIAAATLLWAALAPAYASATPQPLQQQLTRRATLGRVAAAAGLTAATTSLPSLAAKAANPSPQITHRCEFQVRFMEPLTEQNNYSSASAPRRPVQFELYGSDAPRAVENFLQYLKPATVTAAAGDEVSTPCILLTSSIDPTHISDQSAPLTSLTTD